jgi:hypothetical protein
MNIILYYIYVSNDDEGEDILNVIQVELYKL